MGNVGCVKAVKGFPELSAHTRPQFEKTFNIFNIINIYCILGHVHGFRCATLSISLVFEKLQGTPNIFPLSDILERQLKIATKFHKMFGSRAVEVLIDFGDAPVTFSDFLSYRFCISRVSGAFRVFRNYIVMRRV